MKRKNKSKIKLLPGEIKVDFKKEIRQAAKIILKVLVRADKMKVTDLPKQIKLKPYIAYGAMGCLVMEDKVFVTRLKKTLYIRLLPKRKPVKKRR